MSEEKFPARNKRVLDLTPKDCLKLYIAYIFVKPIVDGISTALIEALDEATRPWLEKQKEKRESRKTSEERETDEAPRFIKYHKYGPQEKKDKDA